MSCVLICVFDFSQGKNRPLSIQSVFVFNSHKRVYKNSPSVSTWKVILAILWDYQLSHNQLFVLDPVKHGNLFYWYIQNNNKHHSLMEEISSSIPTLILTYWDHFDPIKTYAKRNRFSSHTPLHNLLEWQPSECWTHTSRFQTFIWVFHYELKPLFTESHFSIQSHLL